MKKIISAALAGALALSMAACGGSASSAAAPAASTADSAAASSAAAGAASAEVTTVVPGTLTVATSPDFAPYEFYYIDESGTPQLSGFDIALAQAIADELGLTLNVVPMDFDSILMELQNGSVDLGISGFSPEPERAKTFDFSDLYYMGGQSFVIMQEDAETYKSYEDFDGLSVGAQTGSIQYTLAQENTPNADIVGLSKVTDIISELLTGKLEGAFIETAVAEAYQVNYPDLYLAWDVEYDTEGSAVAIRKGNDAMTAAVNKVIADVLADGRMDQFVAEASNLASDTDNVHEGLVEDEAASEGAASEAASSEVVFVEAPSSEAASSQAASSQG